MPRGTAVAYIDWRLLSATPATIMAPACIPDAATTELLALPEETR